jgi:hypothetical protein
VPVFLYEYLIENSIKLYSLQALGVKNRCIRNAMGAGAVLWTEHVMTEGFAANNVVMMVLAAVLVWVYPGLKPLHVKCKLRVLHLGSS